MDLMPPPPKKPRHDPIADMLPDSPPRAPKMNNDDDNAVIEIE